jgi:hypothetical protein
MKKIVLIACSKSKKIKSSPAKNLYTSTLFKYSFQYASLLQPDEIFILSAKYGLLELDRIIDPYEITLGEFSVDKRKHWANIVIAELAKVADLRFDNFILLAGINYCQYLLPYLENYSRPMEGLSIGRQLQYLKKAVKGE